MRPIPRELAHLPEVRWATWGIAGALGAFLLTAPLYLSIARINLMGATVIFAIIAISLVVLTGWTGQISLGQVAFVGIGAAVAGYVTQKLGWDLIFGLVAGGVVGMVVAIGIGVPALRIRGLYLAVTTLAFALATSSYLLNTEFFDWLPQGRVERSDIFGLINVHTEERFYYLTLVLLAATLLSVRELRRSRTGRILLAMRENQRAAEAYGVNATRTTLMAFMISGFLAAFAGGAFVHHQQALGIQPYAPEASLQAFTTVVIGGLGSVSGAILGAIYIRGIEWFLPAGFRIFASGAGILIVLMIIPGGLGSVLYRVRDSWLRWVARRRGIVVPSLVADVRQEAGEPLAAGTIGPLGPTSADEDGADDDADGTHGDGARDDAGSSRRHVVTET